MKYVDKSSIVYDGQFLSYEDEIVALPYDVEVQIAKLDNALKEHHDAEIRETMRKIKDNLSEEIHDCEPRYHINKPETPITDLEYEKARRMIKEQKLVDLIDAVNRDLKSYEDLLDWANNAKTPIIQDTAHGLNWCKLYTLEWEHIQTVEDVIKLIAESHGLKGEAIAKTERDDSELDKVIDMLDQIVKDGDDNGDE